MRLTPRESETILRLARDAFGDQARVFLFGSRTDDAARGGDIDLYIETDAATPDAFRARIRFEASLILALGDRAIDVVVRPGDRAPTAFEQQARASGIAL